MMQRLITGLIVSGMFSCTAEGIVISIAIIIIYYNNNNNNYYYYY